MISGGICDDISFEESFIELYNGIKCVGFDGTIEGLPENNGKIQFVKKNICGENSESTTNLHELIDTHDTVFVKMDIEGWEIPWLKSLNDTQMNKIDQIVLELHSPFSESEVGFFEKINKTHILVHLHPNNNGGTRVHKGVVIPQLPECTYLHKKYFYGLAPVLNTDAIPSPIDMRNISYYPELEINHPPFVN